MAKLILTDEKWKQKPVGPFVCRGKSAIDEAHLDLDPAARLQIADQRTQQAAQSTIANPALEATVASLIRRIAVGQILPSSAATQDPQFAVEHRARIDSRAPTATGPPSRDWYKRSQQFSLRIAQIHTWVSS